MENLTNSKGDTLRPVLGNDKVGLYRSEETPEAYFVIKHESLTGPWEQTAKQAEGEIAGRKLFEKVTHGLDVLPFDVPVNATSEQSQQAIKDYLLNVKKLSFISKQFGNEFTMWNEKIYKLLNSKK